MKMTMKEFTRWAKGRGLFVIKKSGEYKINFKGNTEETAYYTTDLEDAIDTAQQMVGVR